MDRIELGDIAGRIADATVDWAFEDESTADASAIYETPGETAFFVTLANGQRFRVTVTEA